MVEWQGFLEVRRCCFVYSVFIFGFGFQLVLVGQEFRCFYYFDSDQSVLRGGCAGEEGSAREIEEVWRFQIFRDFFFQFTFLMCSIDGGLVFVQLFKQKNRFGSRRCLIKMFGLFDRVRVDVLMGVGEVEVGEGCRGSFESL